MPAERISKVLAAAGVASRRGADELVAAGRVLVDGRPAQLGERVDPETQAIELDGRAIPGAAAMARPIYLALHKPAGVTSTTRDRHAATTVVDLVPPELSRGARLYPVGRLDQDSEGLILLTNDGDWAEHVLHPRYGVEREYAVALSRMLNRDQAEALEGGVELAEGMATLRGLRAQTRTEDRRFHDLLEPEPDPSLAWVRCTIHQGWKRQLRRMFAGVGAPVRRLVRVRIGTLRLDDLATGDVRPLTAAEVRRLAPR
ncbi:MAG TPA: pseudouridine synthase [Candidatus Limnocylindrales bacterium]|nr:pseudouridine synthase [Candidatus Limnocylindrales bacterium]